MLVAIHQPHYLPWLRYFEKIARSDAFVVLDTVQFTKNGWQNRNRVKTPNGVALLTAPVHAECGAPVGAVRIRDDSGWRRKHLRTIEQSYARAPYFAEHAPFLRDTYGRPWERLGELTRYMLSYFVEALGLATRVLYASELGVEGTATRRLANLVKAAGGDRYYSGAFALDEYLDQALLEREGIGLELQQWTCPEYPQLHGPFVPDLSIVDLLMNCGPDSLATLRGDPR